MTQPFSLRDTQDWAIAQERQRHAEALYSFGEYAGFCLLWNRIDFDNGLVGGCLRCVVPRGKVADVYQQAAESLCPECFGTGYEGGVKAFLVRPSLWDDTEDTESSGQRGLTINQTASVQTTADFRLRANDFIFRADGTRWQMRSIGANNIRTGFGNSGRSDIAGYNFGTVVREDEGSVAYTIPPLDLSFLDVVAAHYPLDFSAVEVKNAPVAE